MSNNHWRATQAVFMAAAISLAHSSTVLASLGGDVSTVQGDRAQMKGALRQIVRGSAFTFHEMQSASGVVVREYVSPDGTVFGVTWQGGTIPDLRQLLGPYFVRYQQEASRLAHARRGHGPVTVDLGDVIVQNGGHVRAFSGRAYLPQRMPQGIGPEAIR